MSKMKQAERKQRETMFEAVQRNGSQPTIFERLMDLKSSFREAMGLEPMPFWKRCENEPEWARNISLRLKKTIFKSINKLRPNGEINWRNYGRCIGILERYRTFQEHDVPRMLHEDQLDEITELTMTCGICLLPVALKVA